jgi:hypothetical protein
MLALLRPKARAARRDALLLEERRRADMAELEATPRGAEMLALGRSSVAVGRLPFIVDLDPRDVSASGSTLQERLASVAPGGCSEPLLPEDLEAELEALGYYGRKAAAALARHLRTDAALCVLREEGGEAAAAISRWISARDAQISWRNAASMSADPATAGQATRRADEALQEARRAAVEVEDLEADEDLPEADRRDLSEMAGRLRMDVLHTQILDAARRIRAETPGLMAEPRRTRALSRLLEFEETGGGRPLRVDLEGRIRAAAQELRKLGKSFCEGVDFSNLRPAPRSSGAGHSEALQRALVDLVTSIESKAKHGIAKAGALEAALELREDFEVPTDAAARAREILEASRAMSRDPAAERENNAPQAERESIDVD